MIRRLEWVTLSVIGWPILGAVVLADVISTRRRNRQAQNIVINYYTGGTDVQEDRAAIGARVRSALAGAGER